LHRGRTDGEVASVLNEQLVTVHRIRQGIEGLTEEGGSDADLIRAQTGLAAVACHPGGLADT